MNKDYLLRKFKKLKTYALRSLKLGLRQELAEKQKTCHRFVVEDSAPQLFDIKLWTYIIKAEKDIVIRKYLINYQFLVDSSFISWMNL